GIRDATVTGVQTCALPILISPDLTRNDTTHQQSSGGVSTDNLMTFDGATLLAIAESPLEPGVIWTGSNDGLVQVTRDGGVHWTRSEERRVGERDGWAVTRE